MTRMLPYLLVASLGVAPASAEDADALAHARTLYEAASYDEALAALGSLESVDALYYRALCELALGRRDQAQQTVETLLGMAPTFAPASSDVPPRFAELFAATRLEVLPDVARHALEEGRAQFQAKAYDQAASNFQLIVSLTSDPALKSAAAMPDMRLLAQSFLDLALAVGKPPAAPAPAAPAEVSAAPPQAAAPPTVVPAVVIRQDFPKWTSSVGSAQRAAKGVIRVEVGKDGRVSHASIETSLDARYDLQVLAATAGWRYHPATLNGEPVVSERVVAFRVGAP